MYISPRAPGVFAAAALAWLALASSSVARLGETEEESLARYGKPNEVLTKSGVMSSLVREAKHLVWNYHGWVITAAFVDGKTCHIRYMRDLSGPDKSINLKDYEIAAILDGEKGNSTWTKTPFPGGWAQDLAHDGMFSQASSRWLRGDGARAIVQNFTMQLDMPRARQWEAEVRQRIEQQRRSSVPAF